MAVINPLWATATGPESRQDFVTERTIGSRKPEGNSLRADYCLAVSFPFPERRPFLQLRVPSYTHSPDNGHTEVYSTPAPHFLHHKTFF